jgi:hypothetical protein
VTIGAGGLGSTNTKGGDSSFGSLIVTHGGGAGQSVPGSAPLDGGSGAGTGGLGIVGEGHDGGTGSSGLAGGGAGGSPTGGEVDGGVGVASTIRTGASVTYAVGGAGGGGSVFPTTPGSGGNGTNGPGGGGDGSDGFAGIVVIRYRGVPRASGGTITTVGSDTVHTFTTSGTFTTF